VSHEHEWRYQKVVSADYAKFGGPARYRCDCGAWAWRTSTRRMTEYVPASWGELDLALKNPNEHTREVTVWPMSERRARNGGYVPPSHNGRRMR
jgi:hypothetical protein